MEWTDESITRLRDLWQEGHSTAEIGRRMLITKNAVVGKAHRLTLPPRPSPIRKGLELASTGLQNQATTLGFPENMALGTATPPPVMQRARQVPAPAPSVHASAPAVPQPVAAPTVPAPAYAMAHEPSSVVSNIQSLRPAAPALPPSAPEKAAPVRIVAPSIDADPMPLRAVSSTPQRRGLTCCWPLGDPGTKEFHFCGGDPAPGKPYCTQHVALAYVKLRDRRESVA